MIPEIATLLAEAGRHAPSADNGQPWSFEWTGRSLELRHAVRPGLDSILGEHSLATQLSLGAAAENMIQAAQATRLDVGWERPRSPAAAGSRGATAPPTAGQGRPVFRITPPRSALIRPHVAQTRWGQLPLFHRHTNRAAFKRAPIPSRVVDWLEGQQEAGCRVRVIQRRGEQRELGRLLRLASRARFQTRELHRFLHSSLRVSPAEVARGDGLDIQTLGLPPGGQRLLGWLSSWSRMKALNRIGLHRMLARIEAAPFCSAPALVVIESCCGSSEGFAAGRLMERVWIELTLQGLAVHPSYVLTDQLIRLQEDRVPPHLADQVSGLARRSAQLFSDRGFPCLLMRVGRPRRDLPRSRRLPLGQVLRERSVARRGRPLPWRTWMATRRIEDLEEMAGQHQDLPVGHNAR